MRSLVLCCLVAAASVAAASVAAQTHEHGPDLAAVSRMGCIFSRCKADCLKQGRYTGVCVAHNLCMCTPFYDLTEPSTHHSDPSAAAGKPRGCSNVKCYRDCQAQGRKAGFCWHGNCRCHSKLFDSTQPAPYQLTASDLTYGHPRMCFEPRCFSDCRKVGKKAGFCWLNKCKCV